MAILIRKTGETPIISQTPNKEEIKDFPKPQALSSSGLISNHDYSSNLPNRDQELSAAVTTQIAHGSAGVFTVHNGPSAVVRADFGLDGEGGGILVRKEFDQGEFSAEKLMSSDKAQLVFSTKAMEGSGKNRSVTLTRKENNDEVEDTERQEKVNKKFMEIKHLLGLGEHGIYEKKTISYSMTWHFIEIFDESGQLEERVDILDKTAVKDLLQRRGLDYGNENVNKVSAKLLEINRELKKLVKAELGDRSQVALLHDYKANVETVPFFHVQTEQTQKIFDDEKQGKYDRTMHDLGLMKEVQKGIFTGTATILTRNGEQAMKEMKRLSELKTILLKNLKAEQGNLTGDELEELNGVIQDIEKVKMTALNFILMELNREGEPANAQTIQDDFLKNVIEENETGFFSKEAYQKSDKDEQTAREIALLATHLDQMDNRLNILEVSQEVGRVVYREPRGERFLLSNVRNPGEINLSSYANLKFDRVKEILEDTIQGIN